MRLEQLVQSVEARLFGWMASDRQLEQADERRDLLAEIRREQTERDRWSERRTALVPAIESMTQEASLLPSLIESSMARGKASQAVRQSLELESLRRRLDEARGELVRIDQLLWSHDFRLRRLRRRLGELPSPFKRPGNRG